MVEAVLSLTIPLLGTTLGAALVFLVRDKLPVRLEKVLLGFAGGIMTAAIFFSLLMPSIESSANLGNLSFLPPAIGFVLGVALIFLLDKLIPHLHSKINRVEGRPSHLKKGTLMFLAVTLHNIPEGLTVGVAVAAILQGHEVLTPLAAVALAIGIALQNFPEGLIVTLPLKDDGQPKWKAFLFGFLSGAVEPIAALIMLFIGTLITPILPYCLSFAAGAMFYVVVEEIIPEASEGGHSDLAVISAGIGFLIMMLMSLTIG